MTAVNAAAKQNPPPGRELLAAAVRNAVRSVLAAHPEILADGFDDQVLVGGLAVTIRVRADRPAHPLPKGGGEKAVYEALKAAKVRLLGKQVWRAVRASGKRYGESYVRVCLSALKHKKLIDGIRKHGYCLAGADLPETE